MKFGLFWQVPGHEGSDVPRRHWETIEEISLGDKLGFEEAWLAESPFYPTRPTTAPCCCRCCTACTQNTIRHVGNTNSNASPY
jgi:hypothetical protein